jgi:isopentenyldiphosphate isomerase
MAYPPVVIVDEKDIEIGLAMLSDVWQKGLYHRIVSVHIKDEQGRMLLQLRGPHVKVYPNLWDQAAGGHVDEGFTYESAAQQEIAEELGLENVSLQAVATYIYQGNDGDRIINQFTRVYIANIPSDSVLKIAVDEISTLKWFTIEELTELIKTDPTSLTPGYLKELQAYFI